MFFMFELDHYMMSIFTQQLRSLLDTHTPRCHNTLVPPGRLVYHSFCPSVALSPRFALVFPPLRHDALRPEEVPG